MWSVDIPAVILRISVQQSTELKQRLQDVYRQSQTAIKFFQQKHYDVKARAITLEKVDRVLVKKVVYDGKHKISDK